MYSMSMESLSAERKALLFSAGGVELALRLSQVKEIVDIPPGTGEVILRGVSIPSVPVAVALGLPAGIARYAVVTEATPPVALQVETIHRIADVGSMEAFQLPARTVLPQPAPFQGALVHDGTIALELAWAALGWVPISPANELSETPRENDFPTGRELLFARGGRTYAVPIQLLAYVLDSPQVFPVPLTPTAHRGLLYHQRAIHPVFDLPAFYGEPPVAGASRALLVEAGGDAMAVLADEILPAGSGTDAQVTRPSWDLLFGAS